LISRRRPSIAARARFARALTWSRPKLIAGAHRSDLQVVTWTVNDRDKMRVAIDLGVDGIMTDVPDRLSAVLEDN
jgi:glycerophosphoryl diester phosphodiesterase